MIKTLDILLFLGSINYLFYIFSTIECYDNDKSMSTIYSKDKICREKSLFFMSITALLGIIYEILLKDNISILLVIIKYIGLVGLVYTNTKYKLHYLYTNIGFITLLVFMIYQNYRIKDKGLRIFLLIEIIIALNMIFNIKSGNIYYSEIFYALNYLTFFNYLHFIRV